MTYLRVFSVRIASEPPGSLKFLPRRLPYPSPSALPADDYYPGTLPAVVQHPDPPPQQVSHEPTLGTTQDVQIAAYWLGWEPSALLVRIASSLLLYSTQEDAKYPTLKFQTALITIPLTLGWPLSPSTIDPPTIPTTPNIPPRAPSSIGQHPTLPHQRVSHKTADRIVRDVLFAVDRPGRGDSRFWCVFPTPLVLFHTGQHH